MSCITQDGTPAAAALVIAASRAPSWCCPVSSPLASMWWTWALSPGPQSCTRHVFCPCQLSRPQDTCHPRQPTGRKPDLNQQPPALTQDLARQQGGRLDFRAESTQAFWVITLQHGDQGTGEEGGGFLFYSERGREPFSPPMRLGAQGFF